MSRIHILWFRNNLRLLDNPALVEAMANDAAIVPIYIFDPRHTRATKFGFKKSSYKRFVFLKETLSDLSRSLEEKGSYLIVKSGKPEEILPKLCKTYGAGAVFASQEIGSEESNVDTALVKSLEPNKIKYNLIWDGTLYHKDDIPFALEEIPDTSKAFRIKLTKETDVRDEIAEPERVDSPEILQTENISFPEAKDLGYDDVNDSEIIVHGGAKKALERLEYFTFGSELLTRYKWIRNKSLGLDYSSKLSPYLAVGAISPRTIYHKVKVYEKDIKRNISTWWLVFELVWRDYFAFMALKHGNRIFHLGGYRSRTEREFNENKELFKQWTEGQTGIPFVDAHMRELVKTGYMSNRGRVNCASFLSRDYKVDWRWGAAFFESHLIDYDVSSNWLNWNLQALEIYHTNALWQGLKYDKEGEYVKTYIPELAEIESPLLQAPWLIENVKLDYPQDVDVPAGWDWAVKRLLKAAKALE